ncbi:MAG: hypothetical protein R3A52_24740 [Polyangiales bacterium]
MSVKVTAVRARSFIGMLAVAVPASAMACPQCARVEPVQGGGALAWLAALPLGLMVVGALALWRWWAREGSRPGDGVG